jgi:spore maturation protein CgeB
MADGLEVAFFGSSILSSWWNGACTYYRGILRALHDQGHRVTFYEPVAFSRQEHRDVDELDYARVVVYAAEDARAVRRTVRRAGGDVVVKASGVGVFDDVLEEEVAALGGPRRTVFWDVDAPATLARVEADGEDPLRPLVPAFDLVLTYGGGPPVVERYRALGARRCEVVYNALDPDTHHPAPPEERFKADCSLLANRLPDREQRIRELFLAAAELLGGRRFLLGGNGWDGAQLPANVRLAGHVGTADHNAFNCSAGTVVNVTRESMASNGWSPPTRVFEAAGAGACLVTDAWPGLEEFLEPGTEVLVAADAADLAEHVTAPPALVREIGRLARRRVLEDHTYARRAAQVDSLLREPAEAGAA